MNAPADDEIARLERRLERERRARRAAETLADEYTRAAMHDPLTGLANRTALLARLELCLGRHKAIGERRGGLLYLDLDRFKRVNDGLGHAAGDQLLVEVAGRLVQHTRGRALVARLGGDEFVVLVQDPACVTDLEELAARLDERLTEPVTVRGHQVWIRASIGIRLAHPGEDPDTVLMDADVAMYRAKRERPGGWWVHDGDSTPSDDLVAEERLRTALDRGEIVPWFQPVVDVGTGRLCGVEALARWQRPDGHRVPPGEFVPLAERCGVVGLLDRAVLVQAVGQAGRWDLSGRGVGVSVNTTGTDLQDPGFAAWVLDQVGRAGLSPSSLCLELTERVLVADDPVVHANLWSLRDAGVQIAIDDFGTEHCTFDYLRRFPVDLLKIDISFVRDLCTSERDRVLVTAMTAMARALGVRTVAEGVETAGQLEILAGIGVDEAQGWHLGRPAPAADLHALVTAPVSRSA